MGCIQSSVGDLFDTPEEFQTLQPVWEAPPSSDNLTFQLTRYEKEFIATTLQTTVAGKMVRIDTKSRKLVLQTGDGTILGVAKRCGSVFRIFRMQPNFEGQTVSDKLQRADNAPLYFHSEIERRGKEAVIVQLDRRKKVNYQVRCGPGKSFEKYFTDATSGEDLASWDYHGLQNHVEIFRTNGTSCVSDVGLLLFLVIIADFFACEAERLQDAKAHALHGYQGGARL